MVNDLKQLMRENVSDPPPDRLDLEALVGAGRRRVRGRRTAALGLTTAAVAGVVVASSLAWPRGTDHATADHPPAPDAPVLRLSDAAPAAAGKDYRVLATVTIQSLDRDNGHYVDGVTDDGKLLFRDGPHVDPPSAQRLALMDPSTGSKDWLPDPHLGQTQLWPVALGAERLMLLSAEGGPTSDRITAHVYDRTSREWTSLTWPGLPRAADARGVVGPDGRLYVYVPATQGEPPAGGWPTGPDGEADDADAQGDTFHLWSASLTDSSDVRDEGLTVGDVVFTDSSMVWTDSTNGAAGRVHVRDLSTGEEHSFDPQAGDKCNLLSFGATDDRVVMGEYCGTYADGVRDDRVQILTTAGDQVVTLQGNDLEGWLANTGRTGNLVEVSSYVQPHGGTYVYDLDTDRFLRLSDAVSKFAVGASGPTGTLVWDVPVNHEHGETQLVGELLD